MSSEWPEVTLESIKANTKSAFAMGPFGSNIKAENFTTSGVPVIKGGNLGGTYLDESKFDYLTQEKADQLSSSKARRLDLVVTHRGTLGQVGLIPKTSKFSEYVVSQSQLKMSFDHSVVDPYFVYYFFKSKLGQTRLLANTSQVGVPAIAQALTTLKQLKIPLPQLGVQKSIVDFLRLVDDRITLLRETNQTLEAIAQVLFKSWFVDFDPVRAKADGKLPEGIDAATAELFPDAFEESELGLVPKGWLVSRIGDISDVIDCLHSKKPELIESEFPFLHLSNIRGDGLLDTSEVTGVSESDYIKWTSRIEVSGGDCVITNVGRVGAVAQIPEGFKAAMGRNMTAIRLSSDWPYPTYLIELLQSSWMQTEISAKTDVGTILNALNVKSIPQLRCVVADSFVMSAFEGITRPLRNAMEKNLFTIHTLSNLRDTLLPRLISGQLRIADAEAELEKAMA